MPMKTTPEQLFARLFALFMDENAKDKERENAKRKMDAWLKRHGKTGRDISAILVQAAADDAAAQPPPPPSDPRDGAQHPYTNPKFTPATLVEFGKYLEIKEHVSVIASLWVPFTHVYVRFATAPRVALISDGPECGKSTLLEISRVLSLRPNPDSFSTVAALDDFMSQGPGSLLYDDFDLLPVAVQRAMEEIWVHGYRRGPASKKSKMVGGKRKTIDLFAPMMAAGVERFLTQQPDSRTFNLELEHYTTKPELEWNVENEDAINDLNPIYSYLRNWAATVKLNNNPSMPPGIVGRPADNARGLLSVADSCGPEWGRRAREAVAFLHEKKKAEHPKITILRHGLVIFDRLGVDVIGSIRFNEELKRLDLPDAKWKHYRGPSGLGLGHPLEMYEQAQLLKMVDIVSDRVRPPGEKQCHGYKRVWFEQALRKHGPTAPNEPSRLRLITSD
jgi:Protein of unknown function (DUF3631)